MKVFSIDHVRNLEFKDEDYDEADFGAYADFLASRDRFSSGEGLRRLMEFFDKPQDKLKIIAVGGTNGKSSVCNFLTNNLRKTGFCGLFIDPYLGEINNAISINYESIPKKRFMFYIDSLRPVIASLDEEGLKVSCQDILMAIMFIYFCQEKVDFAVVEFAAYKSADLFDIVSSPFATVITSISVDKAAGLGESAEEVAKNIGKLIKKSCPVFAYPQEDELDKILRDIAEENEAPYYTFKKEEVFVDAINEHETDFHFMGYTGMITSLIGIHQMYNAALAMLVLDHFKGDFKVYTEIIRPSIYTAKSDGRLQLAFKHPRVLVDDAHNPAAVDALAEALKLFIYDRLVVLYTCQKIDPYVLEKICGLADDFVITKIEDPNHSWDIEDLRAETLKYKDDIQVIPDLSEAYKWAVDKASEKDIVLCCGSLPMVREIFKMKGKH